MMKTCRLKICGLSRFGDILAANDILPDYIALYLPRAAAGLRLIRPPS